MATYRDKAQRRHDVFLVEDMQKKSVETCEHEEAIIAHNREQRTEWIQFVKLATAHLPKDVKLCYTNGTLTQCRVYLPNDFMELGALYMEELKNPDGTVHERFYHVTSHHITNRRFCPFNSPWEFRTRSTKSLDKAVKNARTALRPNTLTDVARTTIDNMKNCVSNMRTDARRDFNNATTKLGFEGFHIDEPLPPVLDDIIRQTDMGLIKLSDKSNDLLANFHKYKDAHVRAEEFQYATLCWVHTNHVGDQVVETHKVRVGSGSLTQDKGKGIDSYDNDFCTKDKQTYGNNVPEDVQHKVSVLSMLDDRQYVEEVGYKCSNSVYYIFEE